MSEHLTKKLGRRPSDPGRLARMIPLTLTGVVPSYPLTAEHLSKIARWVLGGNNRYGTCGPTSIANFVVMVWKYCMGEDISVSDDAVFDLYRRSGNPNFDKNTGADDNGVDMTVCFNALLKGGLVITHADGTDERVYPICYARIATDMPTQRAVTSIMGGVIWGVDLQVAQQSQLVWDYQPSAGWGGHAIMGGAYTSDARPKATDETVISWEEEFGTTDAFTHYQLGESYLPIFRPQWDHPAFQEGVDQAALVAAYETVTGRKFPIPTDPPQPPLPPQPSGGGCRTIAAKMGLGMVAVAIALVVWLTGCGTTGAPRPHARGLLAPVASSHAIPNDRLTPGVVAGHDATAACAGKVPPRAVPRSRKDSAYALYHRVAVKGRCCEVDHRIPHWAWGADVLKNLWAEPYPDAYAKDSVELWAYHRVCTWHTMTLAQVQKGFRGDWRVLYREMYARHFR